MARSIWSGSISFGLLNVPVKLYSAVARRGISLRELRESDGRRTCTARGRQLVSDPSPHSRRAVFHVHPVGFCVPRGSDRRIERFFWVFVIGIHVSVLPEICELISGDGGVPETM